MPSGSRRGGGSGSRTGTGKGGKTGWPQQNNYYKTWDGWKRKNPNNGWGGQSSWYNRSRDSQQYAAKGRGHWTWVEEQDKTQW